MSEVIKVPEWFELGLKLGVTRHQLKKTKQEYPHTIDRCISEMVEAWLRLDCVDDVILNRRPCWKELASALQHMGYDAIANDIAAKYKKTRAPGV